MAKRNKVQSPKKRKQGQLAASGWYRPVLERLEDRLAPATDITHLSLLSQPANEITLIEIGGLQAGNAPGGNDFDGYDQIQVDGNAALNGTLQIQLVNGYVPQVGDEFQILTFGGEASGSFTDAQGLFCFAGGDRYFQVVQEEHLLKLVVQETPGELHYAPSESARDDFGVFLNDYFHQSSFSYTGSLGSDGFAEVEGSFAFEHEGTRILAGATGATVFLGAGYGTDAAAGVEVVNANIGLVITEHGYALTSSGAASLIGVDGLSLSGTLAARVNTTGTAVDETIGGVDVVFETGAFNPELEGTVEFDISGLASLSGAFAFHKDGGKLTAAGTDIDAFVGADGTGVQISDASIGVVLLTDATEPSYALRGTGSAALVGVSDVSLSGSLTVEVNTTGATVNETIATPTGNVLVKFDTAAAVQQVAGHVALAITDTIAASGDVKVSKQVAGATTAVTVQATQVTAFFGTGLSTPATSDDVGVSLSNGALDFRLTKETSQTSYALAAQGTAALVGVEGLTLSGKLTAERNTGSSAATLDFGTAATDDDVTVAVGVTRVAGDAALAVAGFVDVSGAFAFVKTEETQGGVTTTHLEVSATNVTAFMGSGEVGVKLRDGQLSMVVESDGEYALDATGTAALVGIDGLSLSGNLQAQVNRLGAPEDDVTSFGGDLTLSVGGFTELSGKFGFEKQTTGDTTKILVAGTDVEAFLGANGTGVAIHDGKLGAVLLSKPTGSSYALDASGAAALVGVDGLTLEGTLAARVNTTGAAVNETIQTLDGNVNLAFGATDAAKRFEGTVTLDVGGFASVDGAFAFQQSGSKITAAGTDIDAFVGAGETGVQLTDASLGVVIYTDTADYALRGTGTAALLGVPGVSLSGNLTVEVNTTGQIVDETITTPTGSVQVKFETADDVQQVSGHANLAITDFVQASGDFVLTRQVTSTATVLTVQAANVTAFLGTGLSTSDTSDDVGVRLSNGAFSFQLTQVTSTGATTYALAAHGEAELVGVEGLTLSGTLTAERNTGTDAVTFDFGTASTVDDITVTGGVSRVTGNATLSIADFVDIAAAFSFEQATTVVNGVTTTRFEVGATDAQAFLGTGRGTVNEVGVKLTDGLLGVVIEKAAGSDAAYALVASGTAALVGVNGLSLSGVLEARVNRFGEAVDETITTPAGEVDVKFDSADDVTLFGGELTLSVGGFTQLSGDFGFEKQVAGDTTKILVAGTDVEAFLGANAGTDEATGVAIHDGKLGAVLLSKPSGSSYAIDASGAAELVGVDGLTLTGTLAARVNTTGAAVNETIQTADGEVALTFAADDAAKRFEGTATLDVSGFASLSGAFAFQQDGSKITVAGTDIDAFVGANGTGVRVNGASLGVVLFTDETEPTTYALRGTGTAALVGVPGVSLSGNLTVEVNTTGQIVDETITTPTGSVQVKFDSADDVQQVAGHANLAIADFVEASGDFVVTRQVTSTATVVTVRATNVTAFVGTGLSTSETSDDVGVRLSNGAFGFQMTQVTSTGATTYALAAHGEAELVGVEGLTLSGTLTAERNTGTDAVTFDFGTASTADDVTVGAGVSRFGGNATLSVAGFVDLSAAFSFEQVTSVVNGVSTTRLEIAAAGAQAFLGSGQGTANEVGVKLTDGRLGVVVEKAEGADTRYALVASGTAALVGVEGLTLSGSLEARVNRFGAAIDETLTTSAGDVQVKFDTAADVTRFGGSLTLAIAGFVDVSGSFAFEKSTETVGGVTTSRLEVAAAGVEAFLGTGRGTANELGVALTNGQLGVVIDKPSDGDAKYALVASGTAALVGVEGLTLNGSVGVRVNRLGAAIDETIVTPGGDVLVKFDDAADVTEFGGSAQLAIAGFVDVAGSFGFKKSGDTIVAGVTDVSAFLGANAGTDDAIGLQVSNGALGLVLRDGKYALSSSGDVSLVGLPGLDISGSFGVRANKLGTAVNETVTTPAGEVVVEFDNGADVLSFSGSAVISVAGIFELSGTVNATKIASGAILIDVPQMALALKAGGTEVFHLGGKARFSIGGSDGFQLQDIGITSASVFGVDVSAIAGALPTFALPDPNAVSLPASLTTIVDGVDADLLNRRKYLDITFNSPTGEAISAASILDAGQEFTLTGAGVADAVIDSVEQLEGNTYRYHLRDRDTSNEVGLFESGEVRINFQANGWTDTNGVGNTAATEEVTVREGAAESTRSINLGPLVLQGPRISLEDFQFAPSLAGGLGGQLTITVGIGVDHAALNFGGSSSAVNASVDGLLGTFDINVGVSLEHGITGAGLGKFAITADKFQAEVQNILKVEAEGIFFGYDPVKDKDGDGTVSGAEQSAFDNQVLVSINSASVEITKLHLKGALAPHTRDDGTVIAGLVVRNNGFHLGEASLQHTGTLDFGGILSLTGIKAGVTDFGVTFGQGLDFDGEVFIAADQAELFPGKTFSLAFKDGSDADTEAVRATLAFENGVPSGFKFNSDQMEMHLGSFLTVTGSRILIDTTATGSEYVLSIDSIKASVKAGPLAVSGAMKKFAFTADGQFVTRAGFGVFLSAEGMSGDSFKWPTWLPIKVTELGITWSDIQSRPQDFTLIVSAAVDASIGPVTFSGSVKGLRIDVGLLTQGQFPITGLESLAVQVGGNFGGAELEGALIGGIIRIDASGNRIDTFDEETPVANRVFFAGVSGKLMIGGKGFAIRFALSELGPLGVLVSVRAPLVLEPVFTGITIDEMTGGIEFFSSLPSITDPDQLRGTEFGAPTEVNAENWREHVEQQVVNQVRALQANPNIPGFLAAFTSPMTLTAAAAISSTHLGSGESFNGQVQLRLSTDGKLFASGKFRFMNNRLVVSGKLYADLSQIAKGNAKVLFLGEAPVLEDAPDLRFLALKGKFEMRFFGPNGQPITFGSSTTAEPTANLFNPGSGGSIGLKKLTDQGYLDVSFVEGQKALDAETITDEEAEFELVLPDGTTVEITGVPELVTTADGKVYRYTLPSDLELPTGAYQLNILAGSFADIEGTGNVAETETFTVAVPEAHLSSPQAGAQIDVQALNDSGYLLLRFQTLPGGKLDLSTILDAAPEFSLEGAAAHAIVFNQNPEQVDPYTFRYRFTGSFGTGPVTVKFLDGAFADEDGNESLAREETFTVVGPTANLLTHASDVHELNEAGYVDVYFEPSRDGTLNAASITDTAAEFTVQGTGASGVTFNGAAVAQGDGHTFRYFFTGQFTTGEVQFVFADNTWTDSNLLGNVAETETFTVLGVTAALATPGAGLAGVSSLNQHHYIDVTFRPSSGQTLDLASIMDAGSEFTLSGAAAAGVEIDGTPEQIDDETFRYHFTGDFAVGTFEVSFRADSVLDDSGASLTASTYTVTLQELTARLLSPVHQDNVGMNKLNHTGYIEVEFADPFGVGLNEASLLDEDAEIELYQLDEDGEEIPVVGVGGVNGIAEYVDGTTWRYRFSGDFEPGQVYVRFVAGSWADNAGNLGVEAVESFNVFSNAVRFQIIVSGQAVLYGASEELELVSVSGEARLSLDVDPGAVRFQLDLKGQANVMYLGTVGAVAGRFVFEIPPTGEAGLWGVMKLDTNFEKLRPAGIDADLSALLHINTTGVTHTETITLVGQGEGGEDLTATYDLAPRLFRIEAQGKLDVHVPDGNEDDQFGLDLFSLRGEFSIEISQTGLQIFAHADLDIGPPELQLLEIEALGVLIINNQGVAGDIWVTVAVADIPAVKDFFTMDVSARIVFNTTGQQQGVAISDRFLDQLDADFKALLVDNPNSQPDPHKPFASTATKMYVVSAGPPQLDGSTGPAGPYFLMQGEGNFLLADSFALQAAFRVEASQTGLRMQIDAGVRAGEEGEENARGLGLGELGKVSALGYLEITADGLVAAFSVDLQADALKKAGVDFSVDGELLINTTSTDKTIDFLSDEIGGEPILVEAGELNLRAAGELAVRVPATDRTIFRISGTFIMEASSRGLAIFADGEMPLPDPAQYLLAVEGTGALFVTKDGVAADLEIQFHPTSSVFADVFDFNVGARGLFNTSSKAMEIEIPERFLGALTDRAYNRLVAASDGTGLAYVIPAGAPNLDGTFETASPYLVFMLDGSLTLASVFEITGSYRMSISLNSFEVQVAGTLNMGPVGDVELGGSFEVSTEGVIGAVAVDLDTPGLRAVGIDLDAEVRLTINTTDEDATVLFGENSESIVVAAHTAGVEATGARLAVHVPDGNTDENFEGAQLLVLRGAFSFEANDAGLQVFASAELQLGSSDVQLFDLSATGVLLLTDQGAAGDIWVDMEVGDFPGIKNFFAFDVGARVVFNTIGADQEVVISDRFLDSLDSDFRAKLLPADADHASSYYVIGAAPPVRPNNTQGDVGPYVVIQAEGDLTIASVFEIQGDFYFELSGGLASPEMFLMVNGSMALEPFAAATISGTLFVSQEGIYGGLQFGASMNVGPLSIFGAAQFEVNTLSHDVTISRYKYDYANRRVTTETEQATIAAGAFRIDVAGYMKLAGSFEFKGHFQLVNTPEVITVAMDATFNAFDALVLTAAGTFNIVKGDHAGIVMNVSAALKSGFLGIDGIFDLNTSFQLIVNTRSGGGSDQYDLGVARGLKRINVAGELAMLGTLTMNGSGYIEANNGVFKLQISMSTNFFGLASLNASGYFSSEGEFDVSLGGSFTFGVPGFLGVSANGNIRVALLDDNFSINGGLSGTFWLFGFSIGSSIGVNYSSGSGILSVSPSLTLDFFFFKITIGTTFNIGVLKVNPPIYPATLGDNGVLYVNIGDRANQRNYDGGVTDEHAEVFYVGVDEEFGGHIVRVAVNNIKRTYRGVHSIVANGGSGRDFIETDEALPLPVTFTGGDSDDRILHRGTGAANIDGGNGEDLIETYANAGPTYLSGGGSRDIIRHYGSGAATIDGGFGDDEIIGGSGNDLFIFNEGYGYDVITDRGGISTLDFAGAYSNLTAALQTGSALVASSSASRTNYAQGFVLTGYDGINPIYTQVHMVHDGGHRLVIQQAGHAFHVGDQIEINSADLGFGQPLREKASWQITEVTADSYVVEIAASKIGHGAASKLYWNDAGGNNRENDVKIMHDGADTALVYLPGHTMQVGQRFYLDSPEATAYVGEFEVTAVSSDYFSFAIPFSRVRDSANTDFAISGLGLGHGDDRVNTDGSQTVSVTISDGSASVADEVFINGQLPSSLNLETGRFRANNLDLRLGNGVDRLTLYQPSQSFIVNGTSGAANLGAVGLRIVATSVDLNTKLDAGHIVLETKDSLNVDHALNATHDGYIDLRVFGDSANILVNEALTVSTGDTQDGQGDGYIRLVAPDGAITGTHALDFDAPNSHLIYKAKNAPTGALTTHVEQLTFAYGAHGTAGDVSITEADDLILTSLDHYDTAFAPALAFGDDTFSGISWVTAATPSWLDQVRDGNDLYALIVPNGHLLIHLLGVDALLYLESGQLITQGLGKDITIIADDVSFRSGAAQVIGSGKLTIKANQTVWNYRLGTAGENAAGSDLARDAFASSMDLTSGDLAALKDGFTQITIGRSDTGNTMIIGDAYHADKIKFTEQPRDRDARFRDPTTLLTGSLIVAGDVQATGKLEIEATAGAEIQGPNMHKPLGGIDSGLTALELVLSIGDNLLVNGWIIAAAFLDVVLGGDMTVDVGARIETQDDNNTFSIVADGAMSIAGTVKASGAAGKPQLQAGGAFSLREGGSIIAPGANALIEIQSDVSVSMAEGTAILAGVRFDVVAGVSVPTVTGANANVVIRTPHEIFIPGSIAASQGIELHGGTPNANHSDYFQAAVQPDHPLYSRSQYAILLTGTLLTFGDDTDLVLAAGDDVIVRGNIDLRGENSNLTVQSDRSVFLEGITDIASGNVKLYGGVALDGTVLGGADATGTSVTVYRASQIQTRNAGSHIDIRGAQDVDIRSAIIAGGVAGASGIDWATAGDATIAVTAGQQVYIDSALQASRSVTVTGGTPGADDNGLSVVLTPQSGINVAGLSSTTGATGLVQIDAAGDLEMMGTIVAGATIVESPNGRTYDWAGHRDTDVRIITTGRAYIGGNTVNSSGGAVTTGGFIRAGRSIAIEGGTHSSDIGVLIHPNSELSTHNANGSITIASAQDVEVRGRIASGGEINDGVVSLYDGDSTLSIEAGHQVRISREVAAGKSITIVGGVDPIDADAQSGRSVVVAGTGLLRTTRANSIVDVSGPQSITFFSPLDLSTYNVQATGTGSSIKIASGDQLTMGGRLQSYRDIELNGRSFTTGDSLAGSSVELTASSLLETINGSITFNAGDSGIVLGSLTAGGTGSDVTITGANGLTIKGQLKAADEITLQAAGVLDVEGDLLAGNRVTLTAGTDTVAGQTDLFVRNTSSIATTAAHAVVSLTAQNNIFIDGTVGSNASQSTTDPAAMSYGTPPVATTTNIESLSGDVTLNAAAGRLESGATLTVKAQAIDLAGVVRTTTSTAATGAYDVTFDASAALSISGDIDVAGSLLAKAADTLTVAQGTLRVSGTHLLRLEAPTVTVGKAALVNGKQTELGGVLATGGRLEIAASDVLLRAGTQVLATGNDSAIRIDADYLDVLGSIRAGADIVDGQVTWTGTAASVDLNVVEMLTVGGQGYNTAGTLADVGGKIQATGAIDIAVQGGTVAISFSANALSTIQSDATGFGALTATTPSSITIATARDLDVNGLVLATDDGADITLTAGKLLLIDGFVQADDALQATAGVNTSALSIYVTSMGVLNTGAAGQITLNGAGQVLIEGTIGQPQPVGETTVIDTASIAVTTTGAFDVRGQVNAQSLVDIDAAQVNVLNGGMVHLADREGLLDVRATGNMLVASGGELLASGSVRLFGQNIRMDGIVENDNATAGQRVLLNAVESIVVTGAVTSQRDLDLNAGVGAAWTTAQLTGAITSSLLTDGLVRVQGAGKVEAGRNLKAASGGDVELQADPTSPGAQRSVQTPSIAYLPQTIDIIIGYRQVSGGVIYTPVVTWVDTRVEMQTGVELVKNGEYFHTMDVTLTQDGYYNGSTQREYFIQGVDYANSLADVTVDAYGVALIANTTGQNRWLFLSAPDDKGHDLGSSKSVTYDFSKSPLTNQTGGDFNVYEASTDGAARFGNIKVEVSADGVTYYDVTATADAPQSVAGDGAHDPAFAQSYNIAGTGLAAVKFVRVTGTAAAGFTLDAVGARIVNPNQAPVINWAGDAPAAGATFNQLSDAQKDIVLATLGYKRLYNFSYANAQEQRTQNGSTSVVGWTPDWNGNATHVVHFNVPGLEDKYIRLPIDAELDLLRVVTQGAPSTSSETVGSFTDTAVAQYTQDKSRYTGADDLDQSAERFAVTYLPTGRETYTLTDGTSGSVVVGPAWSTSVETETGYDLNGKQVFAPLGFLADSQTVGSSQLVNTRADVLVLNAAFHEMMQDDPERKYIFEYIAFYGWQPLQFQQFGGAFGGAIGGGLNFWTAHGDAVARGGHLATINSATDQQWAQQLAAGRPGWLGLQDTDSNWNRWYTGEPIIYSHWNSFSVQGFIQINFPMGGDI